VIGPARPALPAPPTLPSPLPVVCREKIPWRSERARPRLSSDLKIAPFSIFANLR